MNEPVLGMLLVVFCLCIYLGVFRYHHNGKHTHALGLLMFGVLVLRVYTARDCWLHEWDERYHALVAKNLMGHLLKPTLYDHELLPADYTNWTISHIWVHKQPLPLWLISLSLKVFGVHVWAVRVPSIILSCIGVKLLYDIAKYLFNERTAFIAAFLFSIHGLLIESSTCRHPTDHIDICFMFFVLLGVWFAVKHVVHKHMLYVAGIGVSIGCAILCKWLPALIVVPIWVILSYKQLSAKQLFGQLFIIIIAAVVVALPWQLYILQHYPVEARFEYAFNMRHFTETLNGQGGSFFFHFDELRMSFGELIYLPVCWFTYSSIRYYTPQKMAVTVWFWAIYLFFSFCATKMDGYTILAWPAVFIMTAAAFIRLKGYARFKPEWLRQLVAYSFILLPIRFSIERIKPMGGVEHNPEWNQTIERFAKSELNKPMTVMFNCPHYIEMMFLTDCTCYERPADEVTVKKLHSEGYRVIVQEGNGFRVVE